MVPGRGCAGEAGWLVGCLGKCIGEPDWLDGREPVTINMYKVFSLIFLMNKTNK